MATANPALLHEFKAREAREHWKDILDLAESGAVAVVCRNSPVAVVDRQVLDDALARSHPFDVQVSIGKGRVSMWIDGLSVHGDGATLAEAEEDFLDALLDYAQAWVDELHVAPNHRDHGGLVRRVLLSGGNRELLRKAIFDEPGDK
ncbi:MAG: prevent-host-death protein [Acidimicrobiales bacterium]